MPWRSRKMWVGSSLAALCWFPVVFGGYYLFIWSPLIIHGVRGEVLDNGYMLENTSSKSNLARMTCYRKPITIVVLEDRAGYRHTETDNSTGKGTGSSEARAWTHVNDWPDKIAHGLVRAWKIITYRCLSLNGDDYLLNKVVETPKVILQRPKT
jgi:hypothetical protein